MSKTKSVDGSRSSPLLSDNQRGLRDMNQAVAFLDATKHWRLQCENSTARGRHYSCKIWDGGRRVEACARTPLMAAAAALRKLKEPKRRSPKAKRKPVLSVFG